MSRRTSRIEPLLPPRARATAAIAAAAAARSMSWRSSRSGFEAIDEERERLLREEKKSWHNLGAFDLWGVTLAVNVLFIIMHRVNYPEQESYPIYAFLIFGINLPWTLSCIRNYIVVPSRWGERVFIIIWDVLMRREFMRTHIILLAISTAGFQANRCELVVD